MSPQKHILLGNDKWMSNFEFNKLYPNIHQYIWCILAGSYAGHKKENCSAKEEWNARLLFAASMQP